MPSSWVSKASTACMWATIWVGAGSSRFIPLFAGHTGMILERLFLPGVGSGTPRAEEGGPLQPQGIGGNVRLPGLRPVLAALVGDVGRVVLIPQTGEMVAELVDNT